MLDLAAEYSILTSEDPFDQELTQALGPLLDPLATLLSRTPAISNMLGGPFGVNSTLVSALDHISERQVCAQMTTTAVAP